MSHYWSAERDARLIALWPDHSARDIASMIGAVSRNAVIGRAARLYLAQKRRPTRLARPTPPPLPSLTERRLAVLLEWLGERERAGFDAPSDDQICRHLGFRDRGTAGRLLGALAASGDIELLHGRGSRPRVVHLVRAGGEEATSAAPPPMVVTDMPPRGSPTASGTRRRNLKEMSKPDPDVKSAPARLRPDPVISVAPAAFAGQCRAPGCLATRAKPYEYCHQCLAMKRIKTA